MNASHVSGNFASRTARSISPLSAHAPETTLFTSIARCTLEADRADRAKVRKEEHIAKHQQQLAQKIKKKEQSVRKMEKERNLQQKEAA